jgi:hypothetical protein
MTGLEEQTKMNVKNLSPGLASRILISKVNQGNLHYLTPDVADHPERPAKRHVPVLPPRPVGQWSSTRKVHDLRTERLPLLSDPWVSRPELKAGIEPSERKPVKTRMKKESTGELDQALDPLGG